MRHAQRRAFQTPFSEEDFDLLRRPACSRRAGLDRREHTALPSGSDISIGHDGAFLLERSGAEQFGIDVKVDAMNRDN